MSDHTPTTTKEIPAESWETWCDKFTNGNRGRLICIEVISDELGEQPLADGAGLVGLDYDPAGKGNDFVISYGDETASSSHVVADQAALLGVLDTLYNYYHCPLLSVEYLGSE
jgi:hypothetical protein